MNKDELKHILKHYIGCEVITDKGIGRLDSIDAIGIMVFVIPTKGVFTARDLNSFKLILKNFDLYQLIHDKFVENIDKEFMAYFSDDHFNLDEIKDGIEPKIELYPYGAVQWLIKNKYDAFGLIKSGFAITKD